MPFWSLGAPSTMLRMVPLPRFAEEDPALRPSSLRRGTAEGGGGGISI